MCTNCVFPDLRRACERAGRLREAADAYQHYLTTPWLWRYEPDAVELGWTLKRLSEVSDQLGDSSRARVLGEQLLQLWKEVDVALHPVLDAVRARR